jgi:2-oxoisovalerate dehydrogenase E1 component alpha subunit
MEETPVTLLELYRSMVRVRVLGDDATAMAKQGIIHGFAPMTGQDAAQVGSACALDPARDFTFPTYREFGALVAWGLDPVQMLSHFIGYADGGVLDGAASHAAPMNSIVGGTALHAVGWALGAKLDGDGGCAIAYFGDGASSQGEVHEAMNLAGVYRVPVIFLCQNNGYAISMPTSAQVAGGSVAARAAGYGLEGVRVDGNDVEAVHEATRAAAQRARGGSGATVIEAMTYRLGPHATSDDPSRYRTADEETQWRDRDPLTAARVRLLERGEATPAVLEEIDGAARAEAQEVRERLAALPRPALRDQLELAYARPSESMRRQLSDWIEGAVYA